MSNKNLSMNETMKKEVSPNQKFLIDRLGMMRIRAGLSARELSGRIDRSKFEGGELTLPSEVLLDAIINCGSTPEEFFFEDIANYKEAKEIFELYKKLSEENKLRVKDLMKNLK